MDLGLDGKACAVTGASRGIGREIARRLCAEGASVLLVARSRGGARARRPPSARGTAAEPRRSPLDVTAPDAGERIVAAATERFGQLDVLVNNAGTAQLARPRRGPRRGLAGRLGAERDGAAAGDARGGSRHGRARLGPDRQRLLDRRQAPLGDDARVLGRQGGRALALAPVRRPLREPGRARQRDLPGPDQVGAVDGARAACSTSRPSSPAATSREEALEAAGAKRPIGRLAEVEEIAAAIVFLCSERASYVAGAAWCVDGGTVQVII